MNKRLADSKKKYRFKRIPVKKIFNIDINEDISELYEPNIKTSRNVRAPKHSTSKNDLNVIQPLHLVSLV